MDGVIVCDPTCIRPLCVRCDQPSDAEIDASNRAAEAKRQALSVAGQAADEIRRRGWPELHEVVSYE